MIKFNCKGFCGSSNKTWQGYISKLVYSGSHIEIYIQLADTITAVVCKTLPGFFVYFPYYETGSNLSSLFDTDEIVGRLLAIFDEKDAFTVAFAIGRVGNLLSTPRGKRRTSKPLADELPF